MQHDPAVMANMELCKAVVDHVNARKDDAALWDKHWHKDCVSVEGDGREFAGRAAMDRKMVEFAGSTIMHNVKAHTPCAGKHGFSFVCEAEMEGKNGTFPRMWVKEICVYEVKNGKVVREEFQYQGM